MCAPGDTKFCVSFFIRTESPDKIVTPESQIVVDDEQNGENEDTRASQDAATSLEQGM